MITRLFLTLIILLYAHKAWCFGVGTVGVISNIAASSGAAAPTPDVHYRFESGSLTDDSIGSLDLTSNGAPTANTTTYAEGAASAEIDATSEYFSVADNAAFESGTGDYWFSVRFRFSSADQYYVGHLLNKQGGGEGLLIQRAQNETEGCAAIYFRHFNGWSSYVGQSDTCLLADTFYHVVMSYDADGGTTGGLMTMWISTASFNATEETFDNVNYTPGDNALDLTIGSTESDTYDFFLDDWKWSTGSTLTETEAEALFDDD